MALCVTADSVRALYQRDVPTLSLAGVALALFSLFVMPLLAAAKRKVSRSVSSDALEADAKQSALCGYFAGILLLGLILNQGIHFWWADSMASLVMVPLIVAEGKRALEGKSCSHCH